MRVLGFNLSGHGASMCLVEEGRVACAVNLERLTQVKYAHAAIPPFHEHVRSGFASFGLEVPSPLFDFYEVFPDMLAYVTGERDLRKAGIDLIVRPPDLTALVHGTPHEDTFLRYFSGVRTHFGIEHHECHAYQAYLSSPFEDAAILTVDGMGEPLARLGGQSLSCTFALGTGGRVTTWKELGVASSIGGLYWRVTRHLGFHGEQEGNTMALAPFGTDRWYRGVRSVLRLEPEGAFHFEYDPAVREFSYQRLLRQSGPPRDRDEPFTDLHKDLAWACQAFAEEALLHATRALHARTGQRRLAMAGGVALNCVANARILCDTPFEEIYVMPNAGDRGLVVGAALHGYHVVLGGRERHPPPHDYLGRPLTDAEIVADLRAAKDVEFRRSDDIAAECARLLAAGRIVGWVQGGAEFGPRALGHRSILADARTPASKERLDHNIKRREWFRPYAPSVLAERADEYFEMRGPSPYMLQAVPTRPSMRVRIAGVVHVDGTARVQTVDAAVEPLYHRLITKFDELTGVPMVLNTSFNGYGEPMVETAADAVKALHAMGLDAVAVGDWLVRRVSE